MDTLTKQKENKMSKFDFKNMTLASAEEECANLVGTQFGHNMIGLILSKVADKFGEEEADRLFEEYQQ